MVEYKSQRVNEKFDSLLLNTPAEMLNRGISREKIIKWNERMLETAKKNNYKKGIIWAKINIGRQYHNLAKPYVSLKYVNEAKTLADEISADDKTYAYIYAEFSRIYFILGLHDLSLKYNSQSLYFIKKLNDDKNKNFDFIYSIRALNLIQTKSDSALYYLHKSLKISNSIRNNSDLSYYYIEIQPNSDSAKYYLNKAQAIYYKNKKADKYTLSVLYYYYGSFYYKEKKYVKAINYLEKSLMHASSGKNRQHLLGLYNLLAETYRKLGNIDKEKKILEDYKKFNESFHDEQAKTIQLAIGNLEKDVYKKENKRLDKILFYSTLSITIGGIVFLMFYKKKRKISIPKQNDFTNENITKNQIDINPTITLDNLYQSAINRDPNFHTKFQEYYPDFAKKLLSLNNSLQNSELELLAYIYLKIETKKIADILYLSPKTIQNRKYNVRKKLNIPTSTSVYIWLISLD